MTTPPAKSTVDLAGWPSTVLGAALDRPIRDAKCLQYLLERRCHWLRGLDTRVRAASRPRTPTRQLGK